MRNPTQIALCGRLHPVRHLSVSAARAAASALLLLVAAAGLALGAGPRLSESVTDQAGVLTTGEEAAIADALEDLRADHGIQLFVAFVDTTGSDNVSAYTDALATDNSLGGNDALLVVAVEDRSDALWVGPTLDEVTDDEIDAILVETLEPGLAEGDFAGAVIASVAALGDAATVATSATAAPASAPATVPPGGTVGDRSDSGSGGGISLTPVIILVLVLVVGLVVARTLLKRRSGAAEAAATTEQLNHDANRLLLETDEALKDAANDVEFAAAQWGDAEVIPYRDAIAQADVELRAAFAIRQRLDDAEPETAAQREAMLREIVARTANANQLLDAQEERFDQLADLERTAPEQLVAAGLAIEALRTRRTAATATMDRLVATYAPSATGSVAGNLPEADKALDDASAEAERGRSLVDSQRNEAVMALRHAQEGLAGATHLVEAVERMAVELDGAAAKLPEELAAAEADVTAARAAVQQSQPAPLVPQAAEALRAAELALDEARRTAAARPLDPLAALQQAMAANAAADAIIGSIRAAEEQARRRRETAATAVTSARGRVTRSVDYITTRRHAVGQQARTRAAEAEAQLAEATGLVETDPERATTAASRAAQLADEAYRLASAEFEAANAHQGGPDLGTAILGGIVGSAVTGVGRGGWGGSPWGGSGGGSRRPGPTGGGGGRLRGGGFGSPRQRRPRWRERRTRPWRALVGFDHMQARQLAQVGWSIHRAGTTSREIIDMAQTSILGRMGQLVRANINSILDDAEDPEKMLDQLIRDFTSNIAEAEEAVAQTIGNLRLLEDDAREAREASIEWLAKAKAASARADAERAKGNVAEADRFDALAKLALKRQISFDEQVATFDRQIAQQTELTNKLKDGLIKMRLKREELVLKRDELVSRAKMAQAQMQVQQSLKDVSVLDPTSDLNRFEERIRRQEAQARGMEEVSALSLEDQFAELEGSEDDLEIEARLAALKGDTGA